MNKKGLSIIVPIYNAERYLEKCLQSIVSQQYLDIEVILIDDGSTDNSLKICYQYAENYSYIKVYHYENAGLVKARKRGINLASKEFVTFVDSDDWIEPNMYKEMMELLCQTNSDMITSGIIQEYEDGTNAISLGTIEAGTYNKDKIEKFLPKMIYDEKIKFPGLSPALWNKIFKKQYLIDMYDEVDDNLTLGEDAIITYPLISKSTQIYVMDKAYYHYRIHAQSMCHTYNFDVFEKIYLFKKNIKNIMQKMNMLDKYDMIIDKYSFIFLHNAIKNIYSIDSEIASVKYVFPFENFEKGSKVVIYGFGNVGKSYCEYLYNGDYIEIVGIIDKNYDRYIGYDKEIYAPNTLNDLTYDYILIAVENEMLVNEIKEEIAKIGVEKSKILWFKPKKI